MFEIKKVTPQRPDNTIDLLAIPDSRSRWVAQGSRLYFPDDVPVGAVVELTIENDEGVFVKRLLALTGCQQRTSLQVGEVETGDTVAASGIIGRVLGCDLQGDWWLRSMPMFGGPEFAVYEGYIHQESGSFSLKAGLDGARHILVFGKDKQPIKAVGVDVVVGRDNEVGDIDVSDSCPP